MKEAKIVKPKVPKTIEEMKAANDRARVRARKAAAERERKRNRAAARNYLKKVPFFFKFTAIIITIIIITVSIIGVSALISGITTQTAATTNPIIEPELIELEPTKQPQPQPETPAVPETGQTEAKQPATIYVPVYITQPQPQPAPEPAKPRPPVFDHENYEIDDNYEEIPEETPTEEDSPLETPQEEDEWTTTTSTSEELDSTI